MSHTQDLQRRYERILQHERGAYTRMQTLLKMTHDPKDLIWAIKNMLQIHDLEALAASRLVPPLGYGTEATDTLVTALTKTPSSMVKENCLRALSNWSLTAVQLEAVGEVMTTTHDEKVRLTAIDCLSGRGNKESIDYLNILLYRVTEGSLSQEKYHYRIQKGIHNINKRLKQTK